MTRTEPSTRPRSMSSEDAPYTDTSPKAVSTIVTSRSSLDSHPSTHSFPVTRLSLASWRLAPDPCSHRLDHLPERAAPVLVVVEHVVARARSEEHTSELQSQFH